MNNIIDTKLLKEYLNILGEEKKNFVNKTFNTFNLSYIKNSNDEYMKIIDTKLTSLYNEINNDYTNIYLWLKDYIDNVISLEKVLSNESNKKQNFETNIRNYIQTKLPDLNNIKE